MTRRAARPRSLLVAEALGLSGLLMGGALLAGPGGASLAARPAGTAPAPRSLPSPPSPDASTAATPRPHEISALDRNLITAASVGDIELVRRLLAAGASPRATDERGRTALLAAVYQRHGDVAAALIHAGADVNHKDRDANSAFLLAAATGQLSVARVAIERGGADPRSTDRYRGTALTAACQHGDREMVKLLLRAGVPVDHVNALGWTALLEAIVLGDGSARYEDVVQLLIDAGADANLADHDGVTPTRHARERGYKTMVKTLMRARGH